MTYYEYFKRIFDIIFSLIFLTITLPLFIIISLSIYLTISRPIFYLSERLGKNGKVIKCIKFRTMKNNSKEILENILETDEKLKAEWIKFNKLKSDPRVTHFGKILRKFSLDEIPQFINVLKGDMSIVGPRPFSLMGPKDQYINEIRNYLGKKTRKILSIKPGITGLWQTSGRSNLSVNDRVDLDSSYIDNRSILKDLKIILKTVIKVIFPKGAF